MQEAPCLSPVYSMLIGSERLPIPDGFFFFFGGGSFCFVCTVLSLSGNSGRVTWQDQRCPVLHVQAGSFRVSVIHRTLTWTTGSLYISSCFFVSSLLVFFFVGENKVIHTDLLYRYFCWMPKPGSRQIRPAFPRKMRLTNNPWKNEIPWDRDVQQGTAIFNEWKSFSVEVQVFHTKFYQIWEG